MRPPWMRTSGPQDRHFGTQFIARGLRCQPARTSVAYLCLAAFLCDLFRVCSSRFGPLEVDQVGRCGIRVRRSQRSVVP
jgi:hypothetical protein